MREPWEYGTKLRHVAEIGGFEAPFESACKPHHFIGRIRLFWDACDALEMAGRKVFDYEQQLVRVDGSYRDGPPGKYDTAYMV